MKRGYFWRGIALNLIVGLGCVILPAYSASATAATIDRPSQATLHATIQQLESVGDYQTLFRDGSLSLSSEVEGYQEYNYLRKNALTLRGLEQRYATTSDAELISALEAASDAILGCKYKLGIISAESRQQTQNTAQSTVPSQAQATNQAKTTSTVAKIQTSNTKTTETASPATTESNTENTPPTEEVSSGELAAAQTTSQPEVEVPATGKVEASRPNAIAVIAGIFSGAAVLSILIAVLIRHTPGRQRY